MPRDLQAERLARAEKEREQHGRLKALLKRLVLEGLGKRDPQTGYYDVEPAGEPEHRDNQ